MEVSTILSHIDSGHMALPEFQRGYVWNRDQVRSFFDSLYRRHPVGSLLVWATESKTAVHRGDSTLAGGVVKLLLDGQQRITSFDKDLAVLETDDNHLDKLIEQLRLWHGGLRIEPAHFKGWSLGARFYPVLYMLTRMGEARDWGLGITLKASLLGTDIKNLKSTIADLRSENKD